MVFRARTAVLAEWLLSAALVTVVLASLRAGRAERRRRLAALLCCLVVVTAQVVSAAMRWSLRRPFAVDLRSARATPAPPVVMVGYSAQLAISTTLTSDGLLGPLLDRPVVGVGAGGGAVRRLVRGALEAGRTPVAGPRGPCARGHHRRSLSRRLTICA